MDGVVLERQEVFKASTLSSSLVNSGDRKGGNTCRICRSERCSCCGKPTLLEESLNIHSKTMITDFLVRTLKNSRKTHSISDIDDINMRPDVPMDIRRSTVSPLRTRIFDPVEALMNKKELRKSTSQLPAAEASKLRTRCNDRQAQAVSMSLESCEMSPMTSKFKSMVLKPRNLNPFSRTSTHSTSSSQSSSSSHQPLGIGLLHCIWDNGLLHFTFSVDECADRYVANLIKVKSSVNRALDYIYMFHSAEPGKRNSVSNTRIGSRCVGKMKVSSSLILRSDQSSCMETEFVFLGSNDDYLQETQGLCSPTKCKGIAKKFAGIVKPGASPWSNHSRRNATPSSNCDTISRCSQHEPKNSSSECLPQKLLIDEFPTNHELAAVVVRTGCWNESADVPAIGGWGLKFLRKPVTSGDLCDDGTLGIKDARCISVLVPAGFHGGPVTGSSTGPSSLTERWKSGGHCSCGGWDLGCPIMVMNNSNTASAGSQDKSIDLCVQGTKAAEPCFKLVNLSDGIYAIYFEPELSPLQCFSIAVALVHAQTTDLRPNL